MTVLANGWRLRSINSKKLKLHGHLYKFFLYRDFLGRLRFNPRFLTANANKFGVVNAFN
jgi:hypothetical protein